MFRHARLAMLLALVAVCAALPAGDVLARGGDRGGSRQSRLDYPAAPRPGYSPRFVHQLYNNCAFASAQMLLDKWTGGRRSPMQHRLRRATGIAAAEGGPTLGQLRRAVADVAGVDLRWSPYGGDPLTWAELLARLENGGGALVNLWPAKLPRHHRRWQPSLTAGHSVYVERYQADRDRVWLMDPLGRGRGFRGEWIDADALSRAVWRTGGFVWAAATPVPRREPALADFDLERPQLPTTAFTGRRLTVAIDYEPRRAFATLPATRLLARWQRLPDAPSALEANPMDELAPDVAAASADFTEARLRTLSEPLTTADGSMRTEIAAPSVPGEYMLTLDVRGVDGQALDVASSFEPVAVRVFGPLAGSIAALGEPPPVVTHGDTLGLDVAVTNLGSANWGPAGEAVALVAAYDGLSTSQPVPISAQSGATTVVTLQVPVDAAPGLASLRLSLVVGNVPVADAPPLELAMHVTPAPPDPAETR